MHTPHKTVIVGSGPAGYTAALYLARADLAPVVVEGVAWGGLLQETTTVENYPGFPDGVMGPELMFQMRRQAERFGAVFSTEQADSIDLSKTPGTPHRVRVAGETLEASSVILAMGAQHRKLNVSGETELAGRGVSYCATCDAAFFRNKTAVVVGGGDSAMEEALFLANFATQVTIVNRRDAFRASSIMLERARSRDNIDFLAPYRVERFRANGSGALAHVDLVSTADRTELTLPTNGAFVAIGHEPQSELVRTQVPCDDRGYVQVEGRTSRTLVPGVFAAGDLIDSTYRQAITAAGSGCAAALDAQAYLAAKSAHGTSPQTRWREDDSDLA